MASSALGLLVYDACLRCAQHENPDLRFARLCVVDTEGDPSEVFVAAVTAAVRSNVHVDVHMVVGERARTVNMDHCDIIPGRVSLFYYVDMAHYFKWVKDAADAVFINDTTADPATLRRTLDMLNGNSVNVFGIRMAKYDAQLLKRCHVYAWRAGFLLVPAYADHEGVRFFSAYPRDSQDPQCVNRSGTRPVLDATSARAAFPLLEVNAMEVDE